MGKQLIKEGLVACASVLPTGVSYFMWEGEEVEASESLLILKTTYDAYDAVENWIVKNHSYKNPEVVGLRIEKGSAIYLDWIKSVVTESRQKIK